MSSPLPPVAEAQPACAGCLRRGWLLSELSGPLDYRARDRSRLLELLALEDLELLSALAGGRRAELRAAYERLRGDELRGEPSLVTICRHHMCFPSALNGPSSPRMLYVAGDRERLLRLTAAPVVAIVGSISASDYGMEMARSLARGLSASGVTVVACLTDGISVAAHAGALDGEGASIAVMGGGLGVSCPARRRSLYELLTHRGCAISELPPDCSGRRWGQLAGGRIVVELAALTVLVEAEPTPGELAHARLAQSLGRTVAAIPGRLTSPLSRGPHALLMEGARLIRGAEDALELLYMAGAARCDGRQGPGPSLRGERRGELEPRLAETLGRVGSGHDTPDKLAGADAGPAEVLLRLTELELMGLLARGDGGRYVPRDPLPGDG